MHNDKDNEIKSCITAKNRHKKVFQHKVCFNPRQRGRMHSAIVLLLDLQAGADGGRADVYLSFLGPIEICQDYWTIF